MSDQWRELNTQFGAQEIQRGEEPKKPSNRWQELNEIQNLPANNPLYGDESFRELRDLYNQFQAGDNTVARDVNQLTQQLAVKYSMNPQDVGRLLGVEQPARPRRRNVGEALGEAAEATTVLSARPEGGTSAVVAATDMLEPFIEPLQQMLFRGVQSQIQSVKEGESFTEAMDRVADSYRDIEWGRIFGPGLQQEAVRFGDVLETAGVDNKTAVRVFGFLGDVGLDPLIAGSYLRGIGGIAKRAGAKGTGANLTRLGNNVERAMSPVGAIGAARSGMRGVIGDAGMQALDRRTGAFFNGILNTTIDLTKGGQGPHPLQPRGAKSVGEYIFARGQNPAMSERSVFEGGAGVPTEFLRSKGRAARETEQMLDFVNENMQQVREVLGDERFRRVVRGGISAQHRAARSFERTVDLPGEVRDVINNLAVETADNTSPLFSDEVLRILKDVPVRSERGVVAPSVGEELSSVREALPPRTNILFNRNVERVRESAERAGMDPEEAERAFRFVTTRLMEADALTGWHQSLYMPMKERLFEESARMGAGADEAAALWREGIRMGADGQTTDSLLQGVQDVFTQDVVGDARPQFLRYLQEARNPAEAPSGGRIIGTPEGRQVEEQLWRLTQKEGQVGEAARRTLLGRVVNEMGTQQLDIMQYFQGLNRGHLRKVYGLNSSDFEAYTQSLRAGGAAPNRMIVDTLYTEALEGRVPPSMQDDIASYIERVSPTNPEERGFLVKQANMMRYLLEQGHSREDVQRGLGELVRVMNRDGSLDDLATNLEDLVRRREGAAMRQGPSTGRSFTEERMGFTGAQRAAFNELGLQTPTAESRARLQEAFPAGEEVWDQDAVADMGRLLEANVASRESAQAAARKYPVQRFMSDIFEWSRDRGIMYRPDDAARPSHYVLMSGEPYGPLNGYAVHPWIKKEVDNALRVGGRRASAAGRIRGAIMGNFLMSPNITAVNVGGGVMSAALMGENPVTFMRDFARVLGDAAEAGGLHKIDEYEDVADLFRSGVLRSQFARGINTARLNAVQESSDWATQLKELTGSMMEAYERFQHRPGTAVGWLAAPLRRTPGVRKTGAAKGTARALERVGETAGRGTGWMGLEWFQGSEDAMKLTEYRRVLKRTGSKDQAYKAARNVVFDYDSLPESIALLRDTGLIMFPGFATMMTGRIFNSLARRPGALAPFEHLGDAIWNAAFPSEDVKAGVVASMEDYQREDKFIPIRREGERTSLLPLNQIFPTSPWAGNPLTESLQNLGVYQGGFDVVRAFSEQGEATLGAQYGQRVFRASDEGTPAMWRQTAQYLANSYAPSVGRKLFSFPAGNEDPGGLIPTLQQQLQQSTDEGPSGPAGLTLQRYIELQSAKPDRDLFENVMTGLFRTTQPISLDPLLNPVIAGRSGEDYERQQVLRELNQDVSRIYFDENLSSDERDRRAREIIDRRLDMSEEQRERVLTVLRAGAELRRAQEGQERERRQPTPFEELNEMPMPDQPVRNDARTVQELLGEGLPRRDDIQRVEDILRTHGYFEEGQSLPVRAREFVQEHLGTGEELDRSRRGPVPTPEPTATIRELGLTGSTEQVTDKLFNALIQQESGGRHTTASGDITLSDAGAMGLTQIMPETAVQPGYGVSPLVRRVPRDVAQEVNELRSERSKLRRDGKRAEAREKTNAINDLLSPLLEDIEPQEYVRFGREYLNAMLERYDGDVEKALAAYNYGAPRLDRVLSEHGEKWKEHLPEETRKYIPAILARVEQ